MSDNYGHRLLLTVLHREAKSNPQRAFALVAKTADVEDGFREVTFREVLNAVNSTTTWLKDRFEQGQEPAQNPTLTYIGTPDLRYSILFLAAIQCRYKVFVPSPRNPIPVNVSLLEQTACTKLVYSVELTPVAKGLQLVLPSLQSEQLGSLVELLAAPPSEYVYEHEFDTLYKEPILVLHSSGSTGLPKPVTSTHGTFGTYDVRDRPTVPGRVNHDGLGTLGLGGPGSRTYDPFPPFHILGFMTKVLAPIYNFTIPVIGPVARPPSGDLVTSILRSQQPKVALIPPSIVEQIYHNPSSYDLIKQLDVLLFAGGPLPPAVGTAISKVTKLCQFYGSTEIGGVFQLIPEPDDWAYLQWHPAESFEMQPAGDGLYELVLFFNEDLKRSSALYHNFPHLTEWRTKDLFEPHPSKSGLWKFHARTDDILVFSSGEKLNPIPMESSVTAIAGVSGALVVGNGHPQSALLIELSPEAKFSDAKQELWPKIESANALLPGHGRVSQFMVIIAQKDKPFQRAGKGTVIRRLTEMLYASETQQLYETLTAKTEAPMFELKPSAFNIDDVKSLLHSVFRQVSIDSAVGEDENLYVNGMDSIKTAEAIGHVKKSLQAHKAEPDLKWLSLETFYMNPTISRIASVLLEFLNHGKTPVQKDRVSAMETKISQYTQGLKKEIAISVSKRDSKTDSVAITGTTGFLGRYLLDELVSNPKISHVYCLNRAVTAEADFGKRGSSPSHCSISFLTVNFASPQMGLSANQYKELLDHCGLIIHNAWTVNFNLGLDAFDLNLQSVRQVIDLGMEGKLQPRVLFISSISSTGVFGPQGSSQQVIPEEIMQDLSTSMQTGYAESKRIAEHMLNVAATQSGRPITIVRVGQLAPDTNSSWPLNDLVPVFLHTSKTIKLVAEDFSDVVDWLPVDQAAIIINDLVIDSLSEMDMDDSSLLQVFNLVNPKAQPWNMYTDILSRWCGEGTKLVKLDQWLQEVQSRAVRTTNDNTNSEKMADLPALRLLPSFVSLCKKGPTHKYAQEKLALKSPNLTKLDSVSKDQFGLWLQKL